MKKNRSAEKEAHNTKKEKASEDKEIELDFSKVKKIFTNPALLIIILLLIPMFLAGYFRMYPASMPIATSWAENSIQNNIRAQIGNQVSQQYPNLPDAQKQQLIDEQSKTYITSNQAAYDQAVIQNTNAIKDQFKDANGVNYLSDIDTWYWYRQVINMVENGHAYDEVRSDGLAYDNHMYAPLGSVVPTKFEGAGFHVWFSYFVHKILTLFNKNMSVMATFFYVSIIISVLSIVPAFFLARKVGGNVGGFFAAMIIAVHPAFLSRTMGGVVDTDAYNVFFPLLISWLFIEAMENENLKKKLVWGTFAGVAVGLYSFAWSGWWYIFDFILAGIIGYIAYYIIMNRNKIKTLTKDKKLINTLIFALVFLVVSGIVVTFFNRFQAFLNAPIAPLASLTLKSATSSTLWPNVYTTVAELNAASVSQIIGQIGGTLLFALSLIGIMFTMMTNKPKDRWVLIGATLWFIAIIFYQEKLSLYMFLFLLSLPIIAGLLMPLITKEDDVDIKYAIFMTLWFMGTIFTATKGVRFVLLLVPVFGVAFGIAIGKIYEMIVQWTSDELEMNKTITQVITVVLLLFLLVAPVKAAHNNAIQQVSMMNDGWYQSLEKIKNESAPNAIINSWWDFGHWFKAISDRAVTFDGASQNTPLAHWIGKTLLTGDEDTSIGILRMLDCGSNTAFEKLNEKLNDTHESVTVLYSVIVLSKEDAIKELSNYVDSKTANEIVSKYTHCTPPEDYFITSEDMVGKSGVWAHFGSWDFTRAEIWNNDKKLTLDEFIKNAQEQNYGYDEKTIKDLYYQIQTITDETAANSWIAPWPSYVSGKTPCAVTNEEIRCQSGLVINKTNFDAWIPTKDGVLHPKTFIYNDEKGELKVKEYDKGKVITTGDGTYIGAGLIKNGDAYYSIMMDDRLTQSLFTKLFYYDGAGTTHFEKFSDVRAITGERIIVWKVKW